MPITGPTGSGGASAYGLGPAPNTFANTTARNAQATADAAWLAQYNDNRSFWIRTGTNIQRRNAAGSAWENVTAVVQGPQGRAGVDGAPGAPGADGAPGQDGQDGAPGQDGRDGADGAPGQGVAAGGTTGQVLAKASGTDYDTEWVNQSTGGGDGTTVAPHDAAAADTDLTGLTIAGNNYEVVDKVGRENTQAEVTRATAAEAANATAIANEVTRATAAEAEAGTIGFDRQGILERSVNTDQAVMDELRGAELVAGIITTGVKYYVSGGDEGGLRGKVVRRNGTPLPAGTSAADFRSNFSTYWETILEAGEGNGTSVTPHTPANGDTALSGLDIAGTDYEIVDAAGRATTEANRVALNAKDIRSFQRNTNGTIEIELNDGSTIAGAKDLHAVRRRGAHDASLAYVENDLVVSGGRYYVAIADVNANTSITDTSKWSPITSAGGGGPTTVAGLALTLLGTSGTLTSTAANIPKTGGGNITRADLSDVFMLDVVYARTPGTDLRMSGLVLKSDLAGTAQYKFQGQGAGADFIDLQFDGAGDTANLTAHDEAVSLTSVVLRVFNIAPSNATGDTDIEVERTTTGVTIKSSTGDDDTIDAASTTEAGVMTAADRVQIAEVAPAWKASIYAVGDQVWHDGKLYVCLVARVATHQSAPGADTTGWGVVSTGTDGGGGGLSTVHTSAPVSGDGSSGDPVTIADGAISGGKLTDKAIVTDKLGDKVVGVAQLADAVSGPVAKVEDLKLVTSDLHYINTTVQGWNDVNTDGTEGGIGVVSTGSLANAQAATYSAPSLTGQTTFAVIRIPATASASNYRFQILGIWSLVSSLRFLGSDTNWRYYEEQVRLTSDETVTLQRGTHNLQYTQFDGVLGPEPLAQVAAAGGAPSTQLITGRVTQTTGRTSGLAAGVDPILSGLLISTRANSEIVGDLPPPRVSASGVADSNGFVVYDDGVDGGLIPLLAVTPGTKVSNLDTTNMSVDIAAGTYILGFSVNNVWMGKKRSGSPRTAPEIEIEASNGQGGWVHVSATPAYYVRSAPKVGPSTQSYAVADANKPGSTTTATGGAQAAYDGTGSPVEEALFTLIMLPQTATLRFRLVIGFPFFDYDIPATHGNANDPARNDLIPSPFYADVPQISVISLG